jgi:cell division protein FtsL
MRRLPSNRKNFTVHRERDMRALSRLALLLACGLILAGGFVYAAGQHFAAVQYGYKSEELRLEHARLLEEQRRLMLEREQSATPEQLGAMARGIGMQPIQPAQVNPSRTLEQQQPQTRSVPAFINPSASLSR